MLIFRGVDAPSKHGPVDKNLQWSGALLLDGFMAHNVDIDLGHDSENFQDIHSGIN